MGTSKHSRSIVQSKSIKKSSEDNSQLQIKAYGARHSALYEVVKDILKDLEELGFGRPLGPDDPICLKKEVHKFERELIRLALARTGGNQRRAATMLGLKANTFYYKVRQLGNVNKSA